MRVYQSSHTPAEVTQVEHVVRLGGRGQQLRRHGVVNLSCCLHNHVPAGTYPAVCVFGCVTSNLPRYCECVCVCVCVRVRAHGDASVNV